MKHWLSRTNAYFTIVIIALCSILLGYQASKISFSYEFDRYLDNSEGQLDFYKNYRETFPSNDARTLIALELDQSLFDKQLLQNLKAASDSLKNSSSVQKVMTVLDLQYGVKSAFGVYNIPFINIDNPEGYSNDSLRLYKTENVVGTFVDSSFRITTLHLYSDYELSKTETEDLINTVDEILPHFGFRNYHVAGRLVNQSHIVDKMKWEMGLFVGIAMIMVIIALAVVFRSFWGVVIPLLIVLLTALWTVGLMATFGKQIDVLSSLIPSILFIVGISDVIHIYNKYLTGLRQSLNKKDALYKAYQMVGKSTFITSVTTSIGFLSLAITAIAPLQEFGLYTAAGVMIAFLLSFSLFPAFIILLPSPKVSDNDIQEKTWQRMLGACHYFVTTHKKAVVLGSVILLAVSVFSFSQLKVDNTLMEDLPENDPLRESFEFFEKHLSGVRTFDMMIEVKDTSQTIFDYDIIKQIEALSEFLKDEYHLKSLITPAMLVKQVNQVATDGSFDNYTLPEKDTYQNLKPLLGTIQKSKVYANFGTDDLKAARIVGTMVDEGGFVNQKRNLKLQQFVNTHCPDINITITGLAHLIDENNRHVTRSLLKSLMAALVVISLLMAFLYRAPKLLLIAMLPNILPLFMITAVMYFTGIDLKIVTALIFTVAFGITVDDTIHLLGHLKLELEKGKSTARALKETYLTTGKSIIITTLILFSGFIALAFSEFASSYYFGLLVSLELVFAVIVDLTLLPVLVLWFVKNSGRKPEISKTADY
jgi:hypothetical protein